MGDFVILVTVYVLLRTKASRRKQSWLVFSTTYNSRCFGSVFLGRFKWESTARWWAPRSCRFCLPPVIHNCRIWKECWNSYTCHHGQKSKEDNWKSSRYSWCNQRLITSLEVIHYLLTCEAFGIFPCSGLHNY